jgi:uncharacterized protein
MFTMTAEPQNNPTLKRFRAALDGTYGAPLERAVLFGSRARGDAEPGSDYDVAVFLRGDMPDRIAELYRLADLSTALIENGGEFVHAMAYPAGFYDDPREPLMHAIREETWSSKVAGLAEWR